MAHEEGDRALGDWRFAVAEFGGHIDLDGQAGDLFEPVFRGQAGIEGRAAGYHGQAVNPGEIKAGIGQGDFLHIFVEVELNSIGQNRRLFGDFLGHEVLVAALVDRGLINGKLA